MRVKRAIVAGIVTIPIMGFTAPECFPSDVETLGGIIYADTNLSINSNQSCMTCHHPAAGFADPENSLEPHDFPVSDGSAPGNYGGRNAPSAAYAGFSPVFSWDPDAEGYVGGMFWDGRATGEELGDPLAEQARGPFLNPVEMGLTKDQVVSRVAASMYAGLFERVYPDTDWTDVEGTYNDIARAIAAYERSKAVTRFSSKFDRFWNACRRAGVDVSAIGVSIDPKDAPRRILSRTELEGLALFNGKAGCSACHVTTDQEPGVVPPLFTDYTYDNLGIPTNPRVYELAGGAPPDLGLGGRLGEADQNGRFKVPTLRNVAKSAPYGHNGYFPTLPDIVNFYNVRDVYGSDWYELPPEVPENVNRTEMGDLGLSAREEASLVSFLNTLTDE
jgi:cytochrome c peroxidase